MTRFAIAVATVPLLLAGCGSSEQEPSGNASAAAATPARPSSAPLNQAAPSTEEPAAAPAPALTGNGLGPGLTFGTSQAQAVAAATTAFGPPTGREHNEECGEGPMDFVSFDDLSLNFQDGRLAGWSLSGRTPRLRTAGGLTIGAPRNTIGDASVERDSLGPEFAVDDVAGLLDEEEREIVALWAGLPCQFR